jgi:ribonuclease HI
MTRYTCDTDGASQGNPGPSGWAYLRHREALPGYSMEPCGFLDMSTNNRAEITTVLEGLKSIPAGCEVKNRDLVLALGAELAKVRATVPHV